MGLTASGLGSGLDVTGLVSQLMSIERKPLTTLATKEASFQSKLSAFGQVKGSLSALQTAAKALNDPAKFAATKATVGTDAGFSASTGSAAAAGSYAVTVEQLARTQRVATNATASFVPADGRSEPKTLEIRFGKVIDGAFVAGESVDGTFTQGAGETKTLAFKGSTIEELRDAINQGDLGVNASLIDNGTAKQLVISSKSTGAEQAFSIGGTVGLSYDPAAPTASASTYRVQTAQDARVNIDGITVTRSSNTISNAIDGVTLTLAKETTTPGDLTVTADYSGARSAIDAFVKAYNDAQSTLKNLTAYNADTKTAATLTGDSTARGIQNQLRNLVGGVLSGLGDTKRLSDIGLTFDKDGKLAADGSKLDAALKDPARNVAAFFTGDGSVKGLAATVADGLKNYLDSDGLLAGRTDGINASIKAIAKQREALQLRLDNVEKRYTAQFTALDSVISSMTQTSTYLSQQLSRLL
ncbi:MAG: flagellar filament capping protein FliD [Proteobacteria bacterium]|nr:flagellar filament capping protein FliD [Pseudomonadota bacterium]